MPKAIGQGQYGECTGKLGAYKARADQHIRESMARLRQDVDTLKGYFRPTSSQPNTSYSENKSSVSPPVSQTGQPPTRNDDSYHHINKAPVTKRASSIEILIRWQPATLRPPTKVVTTPETALDKLMMTTTMARQPALDRILADVVDTVDDALVDEDAMKHTGDIMLALRQ
ncbi:hypothetical protein PG984_014375 [Apiospora sp. TS-2023a]